MYPYNAPPPRSRRSRGATTVAAAVLRAVGRGTARVGRSSTVAADGRGRTPSVPVRRQPAAVPQTVETERPSPPRRRARTGPQTAQLPHVHHEPGVRPLEVGARQPGGAVQLAGHGQVRQRGGLARYHGKKLRPKNSYYQCRTLVGFIFACPFASLACTQRKYILHARVTC